MKSYWCASSFPWGHLRDAFSWTGQPSKARKWDHKGRVKGRSSVWWHRQNPRMGNPWCWPNILNFSLILSRLTRRKQSTLAEWNVSEPVIAGGSMENSLPEICEQVYWMCKLLIKVELKHCLCLTCLIINEMQKEKQ